MTGNQSDNYGNYQPNLGAHAPTVTPITDFSSGAPMSISYAGPPTDIPPVLAPIIVDSNMRQWMFNATTGQWQ